MTDAIKPIVMPKWGLAMQEGMVAKWLVEEGAEIRSGDEILDIETSKIANVYESPVAGPLRRRLVGEGDTVPVGALLGVVADSSVADAELDAFIARFQEEFAAHANVPVINGLSDLCHPCQVLGDLLTIQEHFEGGIRGKTLVFVGDGNNVARSLALGCGKLGARFILAAPEGYRFEPSFVQTYQRVCQDGELIQNGTPGHAVGQADIIYTDVWTSMGQEAESELRRAKFADFQVNAELLAQAPPHTRLMHCLPAHRGEEVTGDAIDGPRSIVFEQAGNRMHAQKALLKWLLV